MTRPDFKYTASGAHTVDDARVGVVAQQRGQVIPRVPLGPWFLSADARICAVPDPSSLVLLAGGGVGF